VTSKRILLGATGSPWRSNPPTIVKIAHTHGNGAQLVFPVNVTVGNTIIVLQTGRDSTPPVPAFESWTDLIPGHTVEFQRDSNTNEQICKARGATVTAPRTAFGTNGSTTIQCAWEIAHTSLAGITTLDLSDQGSTTNADLGSFGLLDPTRLALMMIGTGADFDLVVSPASPWVVDFMGGRDLESTTNSLASPAAYPEEWFGHAQGTGSPLEAKITLTSAAHKWGGIAVLLA